MCLCVFNSGIQSTRAGRVELVPLTLEILEWINQEQQHMQKCACHICMYLLPLGLPQMLCTSLDEAGFHTYIETLRLGEFRQVSFWLPRSQFLHPGSWNES